MQGGNVVDDTVVKGDHMSTAREHMQRIGEEGGGPAFPSPLQPFMDGEMFFKGMTLLDYFAAQTMNGMLSSDVFAQTNEDKLARWSYDHAESLLAERNKRYASKEVVQKKD